MTAGVRDAGDQGRDVNYGYGIIDADTSVAVTVDAATPNPVFTSADPFLKRLAATPDELTAPPAAAASEPPDGPVRRLAPVGGFAPITLGAAAVASTGLVALVVVLAAGRWSRRRRPNPLVGPPLPAAGS